MKQDYSFSGLFQGFRNAYTDLVCSHSQLKGWVYTYSGEYYTKNYSTFLGNQWLYFLCIFGMFG